MGPAELRINVSQQTWAFALPPKEGFWTLLPFFCLNHVYTTETLGKEQKKHYILCCLSGLKGY